MGSWPRHRVGFLETRNAIRLAAACNAFSSWAGDRLRSAVGARVARSTIAEAYRELPACRWGVAGVVWAFARERQCETLRGVKGLRSASLPFGGGIFSSRDPVAGGFSGTRSLVGSRARARS